MNVNTLLVVEKPFESVTVKVTANVPVTLGLQFKGLEFIDEHPVGRPFQE